MQINRPYNANGIPHSYAQPHRPVGVASYPQQRQQNVSAHLVPQRGPETKMEYLAKLQNWKKIGDEAPPQYQREFRRVAAIYEDACNLSGRVKLEIRNLTNLSGLPPIPPTVTFLKVINCPNLTRFPDLSKCKNLEFLIVDGCPRLITLPELAQCRELKRLECVACPSLTGRLDLLEFVQLKEVLWDCRISARLPNGMILNPDAPQLMNRPTNRPMLRPRLRAPRSRPVSFVMIEPTTRDVQPKGVPPLPFYMRIPASAFSHDSAATNAANATRVRPAPFMPPEPTSTRPRESTSRPPPKGHIPPAPITPPEPTSTRPRESTSRLPPKGHIPLAPKRDPRDEAIDAIKTWKSQAPEEHRQAYKDIASKIAEVWGDTKETTLSISNRHIVSLPPLPSHLRELNLMNCPSLTELPDLSSCLGLTHLKLAGCGKLTELPDLTAHKALREVNLMGVTIGGESERILGLPEECAIMLEASYVIHELYVQLHEAMGTAGYRGPNIRILGTLRSGLAFSLRTLTDEVKSWMSAADGSAWENIKKETSAHLFSQFLASIRETADYRESQSAMTERIGALLAQLQQPEPVATRRLLQYRGGQHRYLRRRDCSGTSRYGFAMHKPSSSGRRRNRQVR